jgi:hypothetical protein
MALSPLAFEIHVVEPKVRHPAQIFPKRKSAIKSMADRRFSTDFGIFQRI